MKTLAKYRNPALGTSIPWHIVGFAVALLLIGSAAMFTYLTWREARRTADAADIALMERAVAWRQDDLKQIAGSPRPDAKKLADKLATEIAWYESRIIELRRRHVGESTAPEHSPEDYRRAFDKVISTDK